MHSRHYALEVFGVGCGIHEALVFYPDLKQILDYIPHFDRIFGAAMALLFVVTAILWLMAGIVNLWRLWSGNQTEQTVLTTPPVAHPPTESAQRIEPTQDSAFKIANVVDLVEYRDLLSHTWKDAADGYNDLVGSYEYLVHFWADWEKQQKDLQFRRMFPGETISKKDIMAVATQFQNEGEQLRVMLKELSALLRVSVTI